MNSPKDVIINDLSVIYIDKKKNETAAIDHLTCAFKGGAFTVLLGPSGIGKSTLLDAISRRFAYDGDILFGDKDILSLRNDEMNISYMTATPVMNPRHTVYEFLYSSLKKRGVSSFELDQEIKKIAKELSFSVCLPRMASEISLGQQRKVCFAKCFLKKSSLILLDEPFSGIDQSSKEEMKSFIKRYREEHESTIIAVSHNAKDAVGMGDYLFFMGKNRIEKVVDLKKASPDEVAKIIEVSL